MHTKLPKSVFFKNSSFFVAWFSKNSRNDFWIRNFKANCLSRHDQKVYSIFQNRAPWGTTFLFKRFHDERKCLLGYPTMTTDFSGFLLFKNLKTFSIIFFLFGIYSLLETWTKSTMTKRVQNKSIPANANIKAKFTFFKKCIHKWKHS